MPDTDFTPALVELSESRIQRADDIKKVVEWIREPDFVESANLEWFIEWINRRPIGEVLRICSKPVTPLGDAIGGSR